jgi:hypothetical protein
MDFFKSISLEKQNSIESGCLYKIRDNYYIKKDVNMFSFFTKNGANDIKFIEERASIYYVYPDASAIVLYDGKKWNMYVYNGKNFTKKYTSKYFIFDKKYKLLISRDRYGIFKLSKYIETLYDIVIEHNVAVFDNFIINSEEKIVYFLDKKNMKKTTLDLKSGDVKTSIMKLPNNVRIFKKHKIYYDASGGFEMYNNNDKLIFSTDIFYQIEENLYVVVSDNKYILKDININKNIFTGTVLNLTNNCGWILDRHKNEICIIDETSCKIMNYDNYKNNNKISLEKIYRNNYKHKE